MADYVDWSLLCEGSDGKINFRGLPFTGKGIERYSNGSLMTRESFCAGIRNGVSEAWYADGSQSEFEEFMDGNHHGLVCTWGAEGSPESADVYAEGRRIARFVARQRRLADQESSSDQKVVFAGREVADDIDQEYLRACVDRIEDLMNVIMPR